MSRAYLYGFNPSGGWQPVAVGPTGRLIDVGGSGLPAGLDTVLPWSYAAGSGGITDTNDVTLAAAPGVGRSNYLTSLQLQNTSATPTEVVIKGVAA